MIKKQLWFIFYCQNIKTKGYEITHIKLVHFDTEFFLQSTFGLFDRDHHSAWNGLRNLGNKCKWPDLSLKWYPSRFSARRHAGLCGIWTLWGYETLSLLRRHLGQDQSHPFTRRITLVIFFRVCLHGSWARLLRSWHPHPFQGSLFYYCHHLTTASCLG